eukprot:6186573-Pleurochrysis_carterae.AAC.1
MEYKCKKGTGDPRESQSDRKGQRRPLRTCDNSGEEAEIGSYRYCTVSHAIMPAFPSLPERLVCRTPFVPLPTHPLSCCFFSPSSASASTLGCHHYVVSYCISAG